MIFFFGGKGEGSIGVRDDFGQDFLYMYLNTFLSTSVELWYNGTQERASWYSECHKSNSSVCNCDKRRLPFT